MLKSRRDRRMSLGLEDLEGRKLLSTMMVTPANGKHLDTAAIQGNHIGANANAAGLVTPLTFQKITMT